MFDYAQTQIDEVCDRIQDAYAENYGSLDPECPQIAVWAARSVFGILRGTTALYHDVSHTAMVTHVGLEIMRGRHIRHGGTTPRDWLQVVVSLLCHDIGYVSGVCLQDADGRYDRGDGELVELPPGHTDAALAPYHVNRGKLFIRQRFGGHHLLDVDRICDNIERTRFPVPRDQDHAETNDEPGLVRAADLIGQLCDPAYPTRQVALFYEFEEMGVNQHLGYQHPDDLKTAYPKFFWDRVFPYIQPATRYLSLTNTGRQCLNNLYAHVFRAEHGLEW